MGDLKGINRDGQDRQDIRGKERAALISSSLFLSCLSCPSLFEFA
jgi:hypothetical protein